MAKFKVSFELDDEDTEYFRGLYRKAKRGASELEVEQVIKEARAVVRSVQRSKKTPRFVHDAIATLADLTDLIQDEAYAAPKKVRDEVVSAIAYFSNPEDLIPDKVPALGFLDDAIMVKMIEEEFKHELWGYRRFCQKRDASEQRPWAAPGSERLQKRLQADREAIRVAIEERKAKEAKRAKSGGMLRW